MNLEIVKMELSDFEKIKDDLQEEFDDFWTAEALRQELENKNRIGFTLYNGKGK